MLTLQPFCELFTHYIQTAYKAEFESAQSLQDITDIMEPHQWFPEARMMGPRQIIYHMGPTNSGKTRQALQRLQEAKRGLYCAPLRLLAAEVANKLSE